MKARLGLLGGMFDPVHIGHIKVALHAIEYLQLDQLKIIPCSVPNHRAPAVSSSEHRLNMLELVTEKYSTISIDPIEINRSGISYTFDTLLAIQELHSPGHLVFVLGMDSFITLPQWHKWEQLFKMCHFMILARPGVTMQTSVEEHMQLVDRRVNNGESLFSSKAGNVFFAEDFQQNISSSQVRGALHSGSDVSTLLDNGVLAYIRSNKLYQRV